MECVSVLSHDSQAQPIEREVHNRGGVEGKHLAHNQPPNNGDAERAAQLRARSGPER